MRRPLLALTLLALVAGCGGTSTEPPDAGPSESVPTTVPKRLAVDAGDHRVDPRQVLSLVPQDVETLTISNFDETRDRFGTPDLTSDSLVSERTAFAERARTDGLLFTDGLLADDASLLWLDYGFTQDDVDWEARFAGPEGKGYVLSFRPGQDMAGVRRAVADRSGPLGKDAEVLSDQHLLVSGIADEGDPVLASDPAIPPLLEADVESAYLRTDCVPFDDALGPDATYDDQQALLARQDVRALDELGPFAVNFRDGVATGRVEPGRSDLHDRVHLIAPWPETGPLSWRDGFSGLPVADPATGRIGLQVRNPAAAVHLVLDEHLPFAVCNEVTPLYEPTGL